MPEPLATFQLLVPGQPAWSDLLGLWQVNPAPASFSAAPGSQLPGQVWQADLPRDPLDAARALNRQDAALREAGLALAAAGPYLEADLALTLTSGQRSYAVAAGAMAPARQGEAPARQGVLERARLVTPRKEGVDPQSAAYGILDIPQEIEDAAKAVADFSAHVQLLFNQPALVETRVAGRRIGLTRVGLTGDVQTWWAPAGDPVQIASHNQLVAQALATRRQWLSQLLLIVAGAVKIGAALAGGPFSLLAIGTIWNYLQEVVKQFQAPQMDGT